MVKTPERKAAVAVGLACMAAFGLLCELIPTKEGILPMEVETPADPAAAAQASADAAMTAANTAWMLSSACLVLLMTPGLAFFYGGMVQKKNLISTMMMSFLAIGVVTVVWTVVG